MAEAAAHFCRELHCVVPLELGLLHRPAGVEFFPTGTHVRCLPRRATRIESSKQQTTAPRPARSTAGAFPKTSTVLAAKSKLGCRNSMFATHAVVRSCSDRRSAPRA